MIHLPGQIPKIIHQTWKSGEIPEKWRDFVLSWKSVHPDWKYRLWTDEDNRLFIKTHYADFLKVFDSYTYNIQRADAIRYFILHKYGGLYADMDVECLQPFDDLLAEKKFVIGYESKEQARDLGMKSVISNALMASIPAHPFLSAIIGKMKVTNVDQRILFHQEVLSSTGPIMISKVLRNYTGGDMTLLSSHAFFPFDAGSMEMDILVNQGENYQSLKQECISNGSYAIHYWANTWVRNLSGDLINPDPFSVQGYSFYPGLDSIGHDIGNIGRDIKNVVKESNKRPEVTGFNTDGFLKSFIRPRHEWTSVPESNFNEGLYVKKAWEHYVKYKKSTSH